MAKLRTGRSCPSNVPLPQGCLQETFSAVVGKGCRVAPKLSGPWLTFLLWSHEGWQRGDLQLDVGQVREHLLVAYDDTELR